MRVLIVTGMTSGEDIARGWRHSAPDDAVLVRNVPETANAAASALHLPDLSLLSPPDALDALVGEQTVAIGQRAAHDGGEPLLRAARERWGSVEAARRAIGGTGFLSEDEASLRGLRGAGARRAAAVGDEAALADDQRVSAYAAEIEGEIARQDLLAGSHVRWSLERFSGAGGGLGFAALALGAVGEHVRDGAARMMALSADIAESDLVVVALDEFGVEELAGSVATVVAAPAIDAAVPVIAVVGEDHTSRRQRADLGIVGTYSTGDRLNNVTALAARIARTWSV